MSSLIHILRNVVLQWIKSYFILLLLVNSETHDPATAAIEK